MTLAVQAEGAGSGSGAIPESRARAGQCHLAYKL